MNREEIRKKWKNKEFVEITNSKPNLSSNERNYVKLISNDMWSNVMNRANQMLSNTTVNIKNTNNLVKVEKPLLNASKIYTITEEQAKNIANIEDSKKRFEEISKLSNSRQQYQSNAMKVNTIRESEKSKKKAEKINADIAQGNYLSSAGHVLKGLPTEALNAVMKTTLSLANLNPNTKDSKEMMEAGKLLTSRYNDTTSQINNKIVQGASRVSGTIGNMLPSIATSMIGGPAGLINAINVGSSSYMENLNEAQDNKLKSLLTGAVKGTLSYNIEKLAGGNFLGKGSLDDLAKMGISKVKSDIGKRIASKVYEVGGEIAEENLENISGYIVDKLINDKDISMEQFIADLKQTTGDTAITTLVLSALGLGGDTYNQAKINEKIDNSTLSNEQKNVLKKVAEENNASLGEVEALIAKSNQNKVTTMQNNEILQSNQQVMQQDNKTAQNKMSQEILGNGKYQVKMPNSNYIFTKSGNANVDNLRQDANKYWNNSKDTQKLITTLEKIMTDKNISIRLDDSITDGQGNVLDGRYENGTITINPNSSKAIEYVATHELTHAIGTKDMLNIVQKYRESNAEFNSKVETLLKNYEMSELTEEALADVSAELFGTQEFISNVQNKNPNLFQKIYNEIKYLWHQLKGYKNESQFIDDLYNKWTKAYNSDKELNQTTKNLNIGLKGFKNAEKNIDRILDKETLEKYRSLQNSVKKAVKMAIQGKSAKEILKATNGKWTKNTVNNQVIFNISDKDIDFQKRLQRNSSYTLGEIIRHDELFFCYPELLNLKVMTKDFKDADSARYYDGKSFSKSKIEIQNRDISNKQKILQDLVHEIQHAVQRIEGTLTAKGYSDKDIKYLNNILEIEAEDQAYRYKNNIENNFTEVSKEKPQHPDMKLKSTLEKIPIEAYNLFIGYKGVINQNENNKRFLQNDNRVNRSSTSNTTGKDSRRERNRNFYRHTTEEQAKGNYEEKKTTEGLEESSSFSMQKDNNGRTLSKEQQEYFKDSKVRDENGNLLVMYHGTPNGEFNVFRPGSYFSSNKEYAKGYENTWASSISSGKEATNPKTYEVYLNIKNPFTLSNDVAKNIYINEYIKGGNSAYYDPYTDYTDDINNLDEIDWVEGEDLKEWLQENHPEFDGMILDEGGDGGYGETEYRWRGKSFVPFNSNQIKNVDNTNPTENPDIRYSKQGNIEWYDYVEKQFKTEGTRTNAEQVKAQPKKISEVFPKNVLLENTTNSKKYTKKKQVDAKIAEILDTPQVKQKPQDRKWAILKANLLDKGIVFEDLSKKAKNRELEAKWDYTLSSNSRGQYAIGNARYEYVDGKKTKVSKGLTEIIDEVGDKVSDFQNYMYHQLNIDRMSLEKNAQAEMQRMKENELKGFEDAVINNLSRKRITPNTTEERKELITLAKQYVALSEVKNKPVFGKGISEFHSKNKVVEFEKNNPEFKKWAQDVYDYLKADKMELVKNGVISQELSNKFEQLYPHYVPIQRVDKNGNAINVPLDTRRTGINAPIKQAKGGDSNINPLFQTMANRTMQTYRASARNSLGLELRNTLQKLNNYNGTDTKADLDNIIESMENETENDTLLQASSNGRLPTFTVFENGNKITFDISEDVYDALKPRDSSSLTSRTYKFPNTVSNLRRGVLTEYNPIFSITNTIKDTQDVLYNSQHATKTYLKFPEAYQQIASKGYWYNEYIQNGGEQNTYFKDGDFEKIKEDTASKVKDTIKLPFEKISKINGALEMAPRLAEYIASREMGRSIQTSMLDASRVTTNFKAGGDVTKFLNRNGATFLNAGVQGTMQVVRNFREANMQGAKGWAILAAKTAVAGLPVIILNNLIWDDDEEYEQLQDYVKDSYYIIGKTSAGTFIRIPKGRFVSSVQKIVSNVNDYLNNNKELNIDNVASDLWESLGFTFENVAPNNPLENNVLSPIKQIKDNTSWYGEDIVPERLQDVPKAEQYDETTDAFSIWLGDKLNVSPMKINYLLDQYGGGVADILLPMGTKQAENNVIEDKFTTNPTMKSKYPGEFFEKSDEIKVQSNSVKATDTDIVKNKYMSDISGEMSDLYKEKRKIQGSDLTDKEKKDELEKVQADINKLAKTGLNEVDNAKVTGNVAEVGDRLYYKDDEGEWKKIDEDKLAKDLSPKTYAEFKNKTAVATDKKKIEKNNENASLNDAEKSQILIDSNYSDKEKKIIYSNYINKDDAIYNNLSKITGNKVNINQYLDYKTKGDELKADDNPDSNVKGKTVSGSKKKKIVNYLNNSDFSPVERLYIYGTQYSFDSKQKAKFKSYIDKAKQEGKINSEEATEIYKKLRSVEELED